MIARARPPIRVHRVRLVLAAVAGLAACHPKPAIAPSPGPAVAARACPAPRLRRVQWVLASDSAGFMLAFPPGFQETAPMGPFRHWEAPTGYKPYMSFGVIQGDLGLAG